MPHAAAPDKSGWQVVLSAALLCLVLGSVHAFSVFLAPLEATYSVSRGTVSLIYSFALITLTIAVLAGPKVFHRYSAATIMLTAGLVAALGAFIAAAASSLALIAAGYSLLFGAANGVGYGYGLQLSAQANPGREGRAMGIVTASYATGAMIAPALFVWALDHGGFQLAMSGLACAMIAAGAASAFIVRNTDMTLQTPPTGAADNHVPARNIILLWLGYGAAVFAGLMVIGHAAEIARTARMSGSVWLAPALIAASNLLGSLAGGQLADTISPRALLTGLPVAASAALLALFSGASSPALLIALACVGFCYGATIAAYPSIIAKLYGMANSPRVFGKVFTAWGTAGLAAPWLAGSLFDISGNYSLALIIAAGISIVSAAVALVLFHNRPAQT